MSENILLRLAATIASRRQASAASSYTKSLLESGAAACARKFGEEAIETVIAAVSEDDRRVCAEAADLLYHLLVLLESRNLRLEAVFDELERRTSQSGLAEKAGRAAGGISS